MVHRLLLALPWAVAFATAAAQTAPAPSRGELLYTTHCVACHTEKVHWRDQRRVTDWTSLVAEVRRWQAQAGLGWHDDDVNEVARYLNAQHYRLPEGRRVGLAPLR